MLISSSFLANAAWHTEQVADSAAIAAQLFGNAGQAQPAPTAPPKPAAAPRHASTTAAASEPSINKNDRTDSTSEAHDGAQVKAGGHGERRVHRRGGSAARRMDGGAAQHTSGSDTTKNAAQTPFLAVLDDVLPARGAVNGTSVQPSGTSDPAGAANAAPVTASAIPDAALRGNSANLPEAAGSGASAQNTATTLGVVNPDNSGKHADVTPQAVRGIPQGPQVELTRDIDPSFDISREVTGTQYPAAVKPGVRGDVAFTARVTERTPQPQAFSLNDAQAAIAASRFGGLNTSTVSSDGKAEPHATPVNSKGNAAARAENGPFSPGVAAGDLADPRVTGGAQNAIEQPDIPASGPRGASPAIEPAAAGQGRAAATSENLTGGTAEAAGSTASARNSSAAKAPESDRAPQFVEPQDENAKPSGETVHDVSLRLTGKDQSPVQVRLTERGGELHVSVRTQDAGLTHGLRDGLSDLVGRLEHSGYRAETWQPSDNRQGSGNDPGREGGARGNSGQNGGAGSGAKQQNPRDGQQQSRQSQQWLSEMEANSQRSKTWQPASTR